MDDNARDRNEYIILRRFCELCICMLKFKVKVVIVSLFSYDILLFIIIKKVRLKFIHFVCHYFYLRNFFSSSSSSQQHEFIQFMPFSLLHTMPFILAKRRKKRNTIKIWSWHVVFCCHVFFTYRHFFYFQLNNELRSWLCACVHGRLLISRFL